MPKNTPRFPLARFSDTGALGIIGWFFENPKSPSALLPLSSGMIHEELERHPDHPARTEFVKALSAICKERLS